MNWGNCDYKQLLKLKENIDRLQSMDMQKFCRDASKELAARLLSLVIPATPVGQYPKSTGKRVAHSAVAGQPRAKPRQQRAARRMSKPMHKACRCSNRAATTTLRLSTPWNMPVMWSLDTAHPAEKVGYLGNIFSPCRSMNWKRLLQRCLRNG